jgi:mono/diheme cytochrome c family protein
VTRGRPGVRARRLPALALVLAAGAAHGGPPAEAQLGERIFREGLNARGEPIRALVGMPPSPLSGEAAACGGCHGLDGSVARAAPGLEWNALVAAAEARSGHVPFNDAAFGRAVSEGIAPDGGQLSAAMPRYSLSRSEMAALAAFLKSRPAVAKTR